MSAGTQLQHTACAHVWLRSSSHLRTARHVRCAGCTRTIFISISIFPIPCPLSPILGLIFSFPCFVPTFPQCSWTITPDFPPIIRAGVTAQFIPNPPPSCPPRFPCQLVTHTYARTPRPSSMHSMHYLIVPPHVNNPPLSLPSSWPTPSSPLWHRSTTTDVYHSLSRTIPAIVRPIKRTCISILIARAQKTLVLLARSVDPYPTTLGSVKLGSSEWPSRRLTP